MACQTTINILQFYYIAKSQRSIQKLVEKMIKYRETEFLQWGNHLLYKRGKMHTWDLTSCFLKELTRLTHNYYTNGYRKLLMRGDQETINEY